MNLKMNYRYSTLAIEVTATAPASIRFKRLDSTGIERLHFTRDGLEDKLTPGMKYLVTAHINNDIWDWVKIVEMDLGNVIIDKEPK